MNMGIAEISVKLLFTHQKVKVKLNNSEMRLLEFYVVRDYCGFFL